MYIQELNEEVKDLYAFEDLSTNLIDSYCHELKAQGLTREIDEDDGIDEEEGWSFIWLPEGQKLILAKIAEMKALGEKYFPGKYFSINPSMYREH